jgi:hypothetical protein
MYHNLWDVVPRHVAPTQNLLSRSGWYGDTNHNGTSLECCLACYIPMQVFCIPRIVHTYCIFMNISYAYVLCHYLTIDVYLYVYIAYVCIYVYTIMNVHMYMDSFYKYYYICMFVWLHMHTYVSRYICIFIFLHTFIYT